MNAIPPPPPPSEFGPAFRESAERNWRLAREHFRAAITSGVLPLEAELERTSIIAAIYVAIIRVTR
jgi:hypothetical protein